MPGVISHLLKKKRDVFKLLKRCRDDFATVKRQRDGFGAFRKETGCHPAPPQALEKENLLVEEPCVIGRGFQHFETLNFMRLQNTSPEVGGTRCH
jgi:hypothetical protein